jgi:hypothetical protein
MVTLDGTVSTAALLLIVTITALVAGLLSDTLHALDALLPKVEGVQRIEVSCAGAGGFNVTVTAVPSVPAITTAIWLELTWVAVAVKPAELCPAVMVTLDGTVRLTLLLESGTANPPDGAAEFSVTLQDVLPGVLIVRLEQLTPLTLLTAADRV